MNSLDIVMIEYKNGAFGNNLVSVTDESAAPADNQFMDLNPSLGFNDAGYLVCYYTKRHLETAASTEDWDDVNATFSPMIYRVVDVSNPPWGVEQSALISIHNMVDPLVLDFSVETKKVDGKDYSFATFAVDSDGDLTTVTDRDVCLMIHDITVAAAPFIVNITNDDVSDVSPKLNIIDKQLVLTWVSNDTEFKLLNIEELLVKFVDDAPVALTMQELQALLIAKLDSSNEEERLDVETTIFDTDANIDQSGIGTYRIATEPDGSTFLLWLEPGSAEEDDYSIELYGAVRVNDNEEDSGSRWSGSVKITDYGTVMVEFDAIVTIEEIPDPHFPVLTYTATILTIVSNFFEQDINDDGVVEYTTNSLRTTEIEPSAKTVVGDGGIMFDNENPGTNPKNHMYFYLKNTGLVVLKGYKVKVIAKHKINTALEHIIEELTNNAELIPGEQRGFDVQLPTKYAAGFNIVVRLVTSDNREPLVYTHVIPSVVIALTESALSRQEGIISGNVSYNVLNDTDETLNATIALAIYDDEGDSVYVSVEEYGSLNIGYNAGSFTDIVIPNPSLEKYTVRIFCWKSMASTKPLARSNDFDIFVKE